jgi:CheY-like chemotaxis protein
VTEPLPPPLRVLLVEDDPDDAELIVRALREAGLAVEARVVASEADLRAALATSLPTSPWWTGTCPASRAPPR